VPCHAVSVLCCAVLLQLPYTEAVIKEALRLMAPGAIATRFTDQQSLQLTPEVRSEAGNACRIWGVGWGGVGWGGGWGGVGGCGGGGYVPRRMIRQDHSGNADQERVPAARICAVQRKRAFTQTAAVTPSWYIVCFTTYVNFSAGCRSCHTCDAAHCCSQSLCDTCSTA
jgi:hypothetical protein